METGHIPRETKDLLAFCFLSTLCLFTIGCGGSQSGVTPPVGSTIQGSGVVTFHGLNGNTTAPNQLSYQVLVMDANGNWTTIQTFMTPDGGFSANAVPTPYWLNEPGSLTFWHTNASSIDISRDVPHRNGLTAGATLHLLLTGLDPWQLGDDMQGFMPNTMDDAETNQVAVGATAVDVFVNLNFGADATQGDQLWLTQLSPEQVSGVSFIRPIKSFGPVPISSCCTPVSANLADIPQNNSVHVSIQGNAFAATDSLISPGFTPFQDTLSLYAWPFGVQSGIISGGFLAPSNSVAGELLSFDSPEITSDIDLGDVAFGNPYPGDWPVVMTYIHSVIAPGGSGSTGLLTTSLPSAGNPIQPLITPVTSPTINGLDFFAGASSVGTHPMLKWQAPTQPATYYEIYVTQVVFTEPGVPGVSRLRGKLITTETSLTLPPNVLVQNGLGQYFFRIRAIFEPSVDRQHALYRDNLPYAFADAVSGPILP